MRWNYAPMSRRVNMKWVLCLLMRCVKELLSNTKSFIFSCPNIIFIRNILHSYFPLAFQRKTNIKGERENEIQNTTPEQTSRGCFFFLLRIFVFFRVSIFFWRQTRLDRRGTDFSLKKNPPYHDTSLYSVKYLFWKGGLWSGREKYRSVFFGLRDFLKTQTTKKHRKKKNVVWNFSQIFASEVR